MGLEGRTFSESWHRVAGLKVGIRPSLDLRKQYFRGEEWYILHDPFNNQFFRFRPQAYAFISRLSPGHTIEEVWNECLELDPDQAPGQEDVIKLLSQLYNSNLLYFSSRPDTSKIFERYSKRRNQEIKSKLLSIMFIRLPLLDPNRILDYFLPLFKLIISPVGGLVWLFVIVSALKQVVDNWSGVFEHAQSILAPDNLILLYVSLIIIKILHEIGHSAVCKRYGGEVHTLGLMFLLFTPLPYMDATSSWLFRNRFQRVLVSAAGILVEIFLAAIACFVWSNTGAGLVHSLAYNVMFIASLSTLLFNANPLLRFDGYYILSDLMDIPNLHSRSQSEMKYLIERYIFNCKDSVAVSRENKERVFLVVFGVLSMIYRVFVFAGIAFFVADKFLIIGLILALFSVFAWVVVPVFKLISYLLTSPSLERNRTRAMLVSFFFLSSLIFLFSFISFPASFDSPGVVEAENSVRIFSEEPGILREILADSGGKIKKGDILFRLENSELELDIKAAKAQQDEIIAIINQARQESLADISPLEKQKETIESRINDLELRLDSLIVRADTSGIFYAPDFKKLVNCWVGRGLYLGDIIQPEKFSFKAVVLQSRAVDLFQGEIKNPKVKVSGQACKTLFVENYSIIPFESSRLPSSALGWRGGGEIATSFNDESGLIAQEPFFLIKAEIQKNQDVELIHGRTGRIHFSLPSKTIYHQVSRRLKQVLQKRYRL